MLYEFISFMLASVVLNSVLFPFGFEVVMVGAVLTGDNPWWVFLAAGVTGNAGGLAINYWIGKNLKRLKFRKFEKAVERFDPGRFKKSTFAVLVLSGSVGLPPVMVSSLYCGFIRFSFWRFLGPALLGRFLRHTVVLVTVLFGLRAVWQHFGFRW